MNDAAGIGVVVIAAIGLVKFLLGDRSASTTQRSQIQALQKDVIELKTQVSVLQTDLGEQRSLKHKALNQLAVARGVLHVVGQLADTCTCGALQPMGGLLDDARVNREETEGDPP